MKKTMIFAAALLMLALMAGCGSSTVSTAQSSSDVGTAAQGTSAEPLAASISGELVLTVEELAAYNGKDGNPAYIAVDGVIYDVTDVPQWAGGEHNGYQAGQDLTEQIKNVSPHGTSVLDGLPIVGRLEE